jgi:hypothetical protein
VAENGVKDRNWLKPKRPVGIALTPSPSNGATDWITYRNIAWLPKYFFRFTPQSRKKTSAEVCFEGAGSATGLPIGREFCEHPDAHWSPLRGLRRNSLRAKPSWFRPFQPAPFQAGPEALQYPELGHSHRVFFVWRMKTA